MDYEPTHVKLEVFVDPVHKLGASPAPELNQSFSSFLHLHKVRNLFHSGKFVQHLELLKSDESI